MVSSFSSWDVLPLNMELLSYLENYAAYYVQKLSTKWYWTDKNITELSLIFLKGNIFSCYLRNTCSKSSHA